MYNLDDLDDFIVTITNAKNEIEYTFDNIDTAHYHADINNLFRIVHSLKAKAYYFEFDEISSVCDKAEDIFTFLLKHKCTLTEELLLWFDIFVEQCNTWIQDLDIDSTDIELSYYTEELDISPKVKVADYELEIINTHRVIVLHKDKNVLSILEKILPTKFQFISIINTIEEAETILRKSRESKILITDIKFADGNITDLVKKKLLSGTNVIVLSNLKTPETIEKVKTIMKTENVFDHVTTKLSDVKQACIDTAVPDGNEMIAIPMDSSKMSLEHLATTIKPLSGILMAVKEACFDDESTYGEIAEIIETDPTLSIKILRKINSPYYGLKKPVSNIKHGIMMIGKKQLSAIILSELSREFVQDVDVHMYNTTLDKMININRLRSNMMKSWLNYDKTFSPDLIDDINTISILTIVGTFLTATAIDYNIQDKKFAELIKTKPINEVEKKLLGFDVYDVSLKVFSSWGFPPLFSSVVREFIGKRFELSQTNKIAYVISIIHKVLQVDGTISLSKEILADIKKHDMDYNIFLHIYKDLIGENYNTTIETVMKKMELEKPTEKD